MSELGDDSLEQDKVDEILRYYSSREDKKEQSVVLEMLYELQDAHGSIPPWLREQAARTAGVNNSFIGILIRMSPRLKEAPCGHEILLCTGERCGRKGNLDILWNLKKALKIGKNGISQDGKFWLRTQNCLKHCGDAPNLMIDGVRYSGLTEEKLMERIRSLADEIEKNKNH